MVSMGVGWWSGFLGAKGDDSSAKIATMMARKAMMMI